MGQLIEVNGNHMLSLLVFTREVSQHSPCLEGNHIDFRIGAVCSGLEPVQDGFGKLLACYVE